jgi:anhydro-N-acetylmuramic acid kinase
LVRVRGGGRQRYQMEVVGHVERAWPKGIRGRLMAVMAPTAERGGVTTEEICELNVRVAEEFARAVESLLEKTGTRREEVTGIGSHGQTICHLPTKGKVRGGGSTLQIGSVSTIATLTGVVTVGDFRLADMAVGGQGAPLVPWVDQALLSDKKNTRCVQNIGGIGNVTYLPGRPNGDSILAFDTGPGNMLIDAVVSISSLGKKQFDRGGKIAKSGALVPALFRELQAHAYFDRKPPKSTGREDFGVRFAEKLLRFHRRLKTEDVVHTLTRLTAWSIVDAYAHFLPELPGEVILCGGGADNPALVSMLTEELQHLRSDFMNRQPPKVRRIDEFGIPNKAKEAASFALLAAATLDEVAANLPSVTGASRPVVLGVVARPGINHYK